MQPSSLNTLTMSRHFSSRSSTPWQAKAARGRATAERGDSANFADCLALCRSCKRAARARDRARARGRGDVCTEQHDAGSAARDAGEHGGEHEQRHRAGETHSKLADTSDVYRVMQSYTHIVGSLCTLKDNLYQLQPTTATTIVFVDTAAGKHSAQRTLAAHWCTQILCAGAHRRQTCQAHAVWHQRDGSRCTDEKPALSPFQNSQRHNA